MELNSAIDRLKSALRTVPDFPRPGIQFIDITPILENGQLFRLSTNLLIQRLRTHRLDKIVGIDARGFIFGAAVASQLGLGFIPMRKKGKLPHKSIEVTYELEYGSATLCVHEDAIKKGERVAIIDDLLATGGTALAAAQLVKQLGGELHEIDFVIELGFLNGRARLAEFSTHSILVI